MGGAEGQGYLNGAPGSPSKLTFQIASYAIIEKIYLLHRGSDSAEIVKQFKLKIVTVS
jgi:hypothetical protein